MPAYSIARASVEQPALKGGERVYDRGVYDRVDDMRSRCRGVVELCTILLKT